MRRGYFAQDNNGKEVPSKSRNAVYYCALGACRASTWIIEPNFEDNNDVDVDSIIDMLSKQVIGDYLTEHNDNTAQSKREIQIVMRRLAFVARIRARDSVLAAA